MRAALQRLSRFWEGRAPGSQLEKEGMRILSPYLGEAALFEKVRLSHGIDLASSFGKLPVPFSESAYLPKGPWRKLHPSERPALLGVEGTPDLSSQVAVVRIPDEILKPFRDSGIAHVTSVEAFNSLAQSAECERGMADFIQYTKTFHDPSMPISKFPIFLNRPRLPVVTFDSQSKTYIGLHIDSWEKYRVEDRKLSGNRICVNIGREERYFMFLNYSMTAVVRSLRLASPDGLEPREIVRRFLAGHRNAPVVRIRLEPGEAYIAPTENLIHEGAPSETQWADIQLTVRGYFRVQGAAAK